MQGITSPLLTPYKNLSHAFSTREGGYSKTPYLGNNLAFHVKDDLETVKKNHLDFSLYLGYPLNRLVHMNQVHGDSIVIVNEASDLRKVPTCDAIITNLKNTPLMVMVADCMPILIYDPIKKVIAVVHAGRAGVLSKILPKTIQKMIDYYHCNNTDLLVVIGPSIHKCCYEIGLELQNEIEKDGYSYALQTKGSSYYLDLEAIIIQQLKTLKIKDEHIDFSPYCTSCNNDIFYSYRAEKNICGRFCGLLMLK